MTLKEKEKKAYQELQDNYNKIMKIEEEKKKIVEEAKKNEEEPDAPPSIEDLKKFINLANKLQDVDQPNQQQNFNPPQVKPMDKDKQIAYEIWKDSKLISITCLCAIIIPLIAVLIAMAPGLAMIALMIALCGVILPCIVFVKMLGIQKRAFEKYGWKPIFLLRQAGPQNVNQSQVVNKRDMF